MNVKVSMKSLKSCQRLIKLHLIFLSAYYLPLLLENVEKLFPKIHINNDTGTDIKTQIRSLSFQLFAVSILNFIYLMMNFFLLKIDMNVGK